MARIYRPRHPEQTVLYQVLFHYFDRFLAEYEERFEKEAGYFRPIVKEVVERYLDCGNPKCGFVRIRCPDCGEERLLMFSYRTRGFCPSCHAKRLNIVSKGGFRTSRAKSSRRIWESGAGRVIELRARGRRRRKNEKSRRAKR